MAATAFGALALPAVSVLGAPPTTAEVDLGRLDFSPPAAPTGQVSAAAAPQWSTASSVDVDGAVLVGAVLEQLSEEDAESVELEIRTRDGGRWSDWTPMPIADDGPDADTDEYASQEVATEPFWIEGSDRVQVRIASGRRLPKVRLTGITVSGGSGLGYDPQAQVGSAAFAATTRPAIVERSSWDPTGACAPREAPSYASDVRFAIIHHTAGSNTYTADQADDVVRSICLYHRNTRGWDDIGYNFLVDRYGRIYEGRAGGMTEAVRGAHTKGFNSGSTGISMMGDFRSVDPPAAMISAMDRLLAWKLDVHHVDPRGKTREVAGSGTHWSAGTLLDLPNVTTHGELNSTSCPGANVRSRVTGASPAAPRVLAIGSDRVFGGLPPRIEQPVLGPRPTWDLGFRPSGAWAIDVRNAAGSTVRRSSGSGTTTAATWDLRDASGREVPAGRYTVRVAHGDARPLETQVQVLAPVTRIAGNDAAATSVALSQFTFDDPRHAAAKRQQSDDVVVTRADDPLSAFAAPVAASHNAPLLLSGASGLGASTRSEISRLKPDRAVIIGDTTQVPASVESDLRSLGVTTVERTDGADLQQTSARAALRVIARHGASEAVVVPRPTSAARLADAVAGAAYASAQELPLLVADDDGLHGSPTWVLENYAWDRVLVVSSGSVSAATMDAITTAARTKSATTGIVRIQGSDPADTSRRLADRLLELRKDWARDPNDRDVGREVLVLPTGSPLHGVAALATADLRGAATLLVDGSDLDRSPSPKAWLTGGAAELSHAMVAAPTTALGTKVAGQVEAILRSAGPHRAPGETWGGWQFTDVSPSSTHGPDIQRLWELGITTGCTPTTFCPHRDVEREEMASFLARMLGLPAGDGTQFSDVKASSTHAGDIGAIADAGITNGYGNTGRFGPADPVTREQMASFLARALDLPPATKHYFSDVPTTGTHTADINRLAAAGLTNGYGGPGKYSPKALVPREQMASFIVRSVDWLDANG